MAEKPCMRITALAVLASLALAACGSSSKPKAELTPNPPHITPTTTSTARPPQGSTASTTATTTSGPARTPQPNGDLCRAPDLVLSFLGQQGATGNGELGFALRNTSSHSCRTSGYPGVQFLDSAGAALPTVSTRTTHDFFGPTPLQALVVSSGESFSFRIGVTHGIASSAGCTTASGIGVIAPNDTTQLRATIPQGAYECGTATVSPVRPGDSAYAGG